MQRSDDYLMLIDGEMAASGSCQWLGSVNPATEESIGRVPLADPADVDRAVRAAARAQPEWNARTVAERGAAFARSRAAVA